MDGEFREAGSFCVPPFDKPEKGPAGRAAAERQLNHKLADVYQIELDVEIVLHIGIMPGCKVS